MKLEREKIRLYLVTDRTWLGPGESLAARTERALKAGATMVQFREKHLTGEEYLREARAVQEICRKYQVPFIINDHVALAKELGADGVHVGQSDMAVEDAVRILGKHKIVGASAHNVEEALAAQRAGASYLGCGAVFGSGTKEDTTPLSFETLRAVCRAVQLPVAAIGGIHPGNIQKLYGCGADGVAVISAVYAAPEPERAVQELLEGVRHLKAEEKRAEGEIKLC